MVRKIPRDRIETGIAACLSRVGEYLEDSERLIDSSMRQSTFHNAAELGTFALKGLGKAVILRKRFEEQSDAEIVNVEDQVFGGGDAHEHK